MIEDKDMFKYSKAKLFKESLSPREKVAGSAGRTARHVAQLPGHAAGGTRQITHAGRQAAGKATGEAAEQAASLGGGGGRRRARLLRGTSRGAARQNFAPQMLLRRIPGELRIKLNKLILVL